MPRVSVVIPTYNRKEWLSETIRSVLAQTYKDYEILVVDHGSTDGTAEAVDKEFGGSVRYSALANCPLPACPRNAGIRAARGDYVAFLDSDDLWLPEKLERQVGGLDADPRLGWSYGNARWFGPGVVPGTIQTGAWQFRSGMVFRSLLMGNFIPSCTVVVRRKCLEEVGGFDMTPALRSAEDYELWLRLAARFPLHAVRKVVARYRVSESQISRDPADGFGPEQLALEMVKDKIGVAPETHRKALSALHLRYFRYAVFSRPAEASAHLDTAAALDPRSGRSRLYRAVWALGGVAGMRRWIDWERRIKRAAAGP